MQKWMWFLCLTISMLPQTAKALTAEEVKAAVYEKMKDRHPQPDPNFWTTLGPDSVPYLEQMYQGSNSPVEQAWLLDGLSHFSDPSIGPFLQTQIKATDNEVFKKKMLSALIESQGDSSFDFVEPYLKDSDGHVRIAVARGMQKYMPNFAKAEASLKKFSADEKEAWVKKDFEKPDAEPGLREKRSGVVYAADASSGAVKALPEKDWAGLWDGVWVSAKKSSQAKGTLTYLPAEKTWKVSLKVPKQSAYDLKRDGMEVLYYTSSHLHWIEVRNKKDDSVFIGQRKP
jgi:hypothetical protein